MTNQVKAKSILKLLEDYDKNKSIHSACEACTLILEEIKAGRLVL